jgi:hypothetical protein
MLKKEEKEKMKKPLANAVAVAHQQEDFFSPPLTPLSFPLPIPFLAIINKDFPYRGRSRLSKR